MSASKKKFILTADDFGMDTSFDRAILKASKEGFLRAACIAVNGDSYEHAVKDILPKCKELDLGIHLNIIEDRSLTQCKLLTDRFGCFCHGFGALFLKSHGKAFLNEVEQEFRAQIEKLKNDTDRPIAFINSHVHVHAIPNIFKITAKLAREYGIKFIRMQAEKPYLANKAPKAINLVKILVLNYFTSQNLSTMKKFELQANNYTLGVGYTGEMTSETLYFGAQSLHRLDGIVIEALIHPSDDPKSPRFKELQASLDLKLKENIEKQGFEICSFSTLSKELHSEESLYKGV